MIGDRTTEPSPRQLACLRLAAEGKGYLEIAAELHIARATVHTSLTRAREILGARNTTHAVHIAHQRGLFGAGDLTPDRRTTA